jgi:hypothetical protein
MVIKCAQFTVGMFKGQQPRIKAKPMPKKKGKTSPYNFFRRDWQDGVLEVALKSNDYKGKPPQRLIIMKGPQGQIVQLDCKYWLATLADGGNKWTFASWEAAPAECKARAEKLAVDWMNKRAEELFEGKIDKASLLKEKEEWMKTFPASVIRPKKMPKTKKQMNSQTAAEEPKDIKVNDDKGNAAKGEHGDEPKGIEANDDRGNAAKGDHGDVPKGGNYDKGNAAKGGHGDAPKGNENIAKHGKGESSGAASSTAAPSASSTAAPAQSTPPMAKRQSSPPAEERVERKKPRIAPPSDSDSSTNLD